MAMALANWPVVADVLPRLHTNPPQPGQCIEHGERKLI
jgi:hypothetical protein